MKRSTTRWVLGTLAGAALLLAAGRVHVLHGAALERPQLLAKVSWALDETLVNLDRVDHLPPAVARMQYPLLHAALSREREQLGAGAFTRRNLAQVQPGLSHYQVANLIGPPTRRGSTLDGVRRDAYVDSLTGNVVTVVYRDSLVARIEQ